MSFKSGYIAILGAPNAGKSTLLNAILGEKLSIVTAKPQTTRKRFVGLHTTPTCQMIFLDTPGIHVLDKDLNHFMSTEVMAAIGDADVLIFLLPLDQELSEDLVRIVEECQKKFPYKKKLVVTGKIDLFPVGAKHASPLRGLDVMTHFASFENLPISAKTGEGIPQLLKRLEEFLPEGPAYFDGDDLTTENVRDIVAELIREKAFENLHEEIPYGLAVEILKFKEGETITKVEANLIVERDSQKGMVVGKGGEMIKKIGSLSRPDIEKLVGGKVFLELHVRLDKNWTKDPARLAYYGYRASRK